MDNFDWEEFAQILAKKLRKIDEFAPPSGPNGDPEKRRRKAEEEEEEEIKEVKTRRIQEEEGELVEIEGFREFILNLPPEIVQMIINFLPPFEGGLLIKYSKLARVREIDEPALQIIRSLVSRQFFEHSLMVFENLDHPEHYLFWFARFLDSEDMMRWLFRMLKIPQYYLDGSDLLFGQGLYDWAISIGYTESDALEMKRLDNFGIWLLDQGQDVYPAHFLERLIDELTPGKVFGVEKPQLSMEEVFQIVGGDEIGREYLEYIRNRDKRRRYLMGTHRMIELAFSIMLYEYYLVEDQLDRRFELAITTHQYTPLSVYKDLHGRGYAPTYANDEFLALPTLIMTVTPYRRNLGPVWLARPLAQFGYASPDFVDKLRQPDSDDSIEFILKQTSWIEYSPELLLEAIIHYGLLGRQPNEGWLGYLFKETPDPIKDRMVEFLARAEEALCDKPMCSVHRARPGDFTNLFLAHWQFDDKTFDDWRMVSASTMVEMLSRDVPLNIPPKFSNELLWDWHPQIIEKVLLNFNGDFRINDYEVITDLPISIQSISNPLYIDTFNEILKFKYWKTDDMKTTFQDLAYLRKAIEYDTPPLTLALRRKLFMLFKEILDNVEAAQFIGDATYRDFQRFMEDNREFFSIQ
jgi:hypothetical protein